VLNGAMARMSAYGEHKTPVEPRKFSEAIIVGSGLA